MIHLVRHGETHGNAARVFQQPDTPLSSHGLAQAAALGERFRALPVGAVLCSDYARARQTADAVANATDAPLHVEPLLRERNFGALRGTPYAELDTDPFAADFVPPEGESWSVFHARVDDAYASVIALARRTPEPLVVVTHGLVLGSLVERHLAVEVSVGGFANTAVTSVEREPPHRVHRLGCTEHLEQVRDVAPA